MRSKFLITVLVVCSLLACKNEQEKPIDWKKVVEQVVNQFEDNKSLLREGELDVKKQVISYKVFNDETSGITKYEMYSSLGGNFSMLEEIYLKNTKIIFSNWSGLSPYIKDGKLKFDDSSVCCAVFENKTYFKSPKKAVVYKRKIDLKDVQGTQSAKLDLNKMAFEVDTIKQAYPVYDRLLRTIEMVAQ